LHTEIDSEHTASNSAPRTGERRPEKRTLPKPWSPPAPLAVTPLSYRWYPVCKSIFDRAAALVLIVLSGPLILLLALVVRLSSRGPAFYSQTRMGRGGKLFRIYKLRTMVNKCESLTGPRWSMPGDPRVTGLGQFLRKTHLDELPQLINVLRGDMSLIGPRPERPEFLPELEGACPRYRERLAVRPGVTGLAQVQLPPDTSVGSVRRKLIYDLYYIRHLSPWLDLSLVFCTAFYAVGVPFRIVGRVLGVPSGEKVENEMRPLIDAATRRAA
jgi:lipopolysaccharide/colanic/teichoic acid biosynthesis glycosyltransferase